MIEYQSSGPITRNTKCGCGCNGKYDPSVFATCKGCNHKFSPPKSDKMPWWEECPKCKE